MLNIQKVVLAGPWGFSCLAKKLPGVVWDMQGKLFQRQEARVHPIGVPRGGKDKWIVKGGCVNCGWSVMSIIVSGNESWSGVLLCRRVEPGDSVFLDGSSV
jgi:hypothetical protein